jgi:Methyltransferase domain
VEQSNQINSFAAQDLAGKAILFEIGARAGLLSIIDDSDSVTVSALTKELNMKEDFLDTYLNILTNLGLLHKSADNIYAKTAAYEQEKNKIGYIAWGMMSCAPLITNTESFITDFDAAIRNYHRCGEHVARTSTWMGGRDFYPQVEKIVLDLQPKKVVDLGSGTCELLIRVANKVLGMKGIGVDLSKEACEKAVAHIKELSLEDRINVLVGPIQELVNDNEVFMDADVVHAGFVFHDLMPEDEKILDQLLAHIRQSSPHVTLLIVDAIPFANNQNEMAFSSAFSLLHKFFMGRKLLPEADWEAKLQKAGFSSIKIEKLGISGGRIFVASNK